jgi:uroporphyrinogen decarboxylase
MDSTVLLGPREVAVARALAVLRAAGPRPGYIFNLGHGIQPGTPPENVKAVVDAVHGHAWK